MFNMVRVKPKAAAPEDVKAKKLRVCFGFQGFLAYVPAARAQATVSASTIDDKFRQIRTSNKEGYLHVFTRTAVNLSEM